MRLLTIKMSNTINQEAFTSKKNSILESLDRYQNVAKDPAFNPTEAIKKINIEREKYTKQSCHQNEKQVFTFLDNFCTMNKDCDEIYKECPVKDSDFIENTTCEEESMDVDMDQPERSGVIENKFVPKFQSTNKFTGKPDIDMNVYNREIEIEDLYTEETLPPTVNSETPADGPVKFKKVNKNLKKRLNNLDN